MHVETHESLDSAVFRPGVEGVLRSFTEAKVSPHCKNTFLHIKAQCYQLNVPSPRIAGLNLRGS